MNVEALNNKHIAANDGLTWIGSYSQEEIDAMYAQYEQYCANADSKVAYLKVGDVTTSGEVFATAWEEEGLVVDGSQVPGGVAGEKYLKVIYEDHTAGTLFASNITVSSDELIESYKPITRHSSTGSSKRSTHTQPCRVRSANNRTRR